MSHRSFLSLRAAKANTLLKLKRKANTVLNHLKGQNRPKPFEGIALVVNGQIINTEPIRLPEKKFHSTVARHLYGVRYSVHLSCKMLNGDTLAALHSRPRRGLFENEIGKRRGQCSGMVVSRELQRLFTFRRLDLACFSALYPAAASSSRNILADL